MSSNVCHQIIYLAIELSSSSWVIAYRVPRNDKAKLHRLEAGDGAGLLAFIAGLRHRLDPSDDASTLVVSCFEAGRDGFWLHRLLTAHGVINPVVEPTSILVTRGARRAKTDRLDAVGLLRVLAAKFAGDPGACRTVVVPSVEEEDAKRPHREREFLVQERVRIENRIAALLAAQGVRERPSLRSWDADMRALRTGDAPAADPSRRRVEPLAPAAVADPRNDPRTRRGSRAGSGNATRLRKPNGQSALHDPRNRRNRGVWVYVRDGRPFGGKDPPAALFYGSRDRTREHPERHLSSYAGILQADAFDGYNRLYLPDRKPGLIVEALCWSHAQRKFFELADIAANARRGKNAPPISPIALEAVKRIDALFGIEREINGLTAEERLRARGKESAALVAGLEDWMRAERAKLSRHAAVAKAIDYMLTR